MEGESKQMSSFENCICLCIVLSFLTMPKERKEDIPGEERIK